jgi:hypothetical protein
VHFRLPFYYSFVLVITLHYHFIPALAEYQPLVYSTLLFPPATQTCCSEGEGGLEFFNEEFWPTCCPGCRSCGVMESSTVSVSLRVAIVFRDITYVIIILYSWHLVICEHFWPYVWNN